MSCILIKLQISRSVCQGSLLNFASIKQVCESWFVIYGIRVRVETLGSIWAQYAPTYSLSELTIEFFLVITKNQQVLTALQYRYLKMYQTQIFIDVVVVQEKVERLLKITMKMAHFFHHFHVRMMTYVHMYLVISLITFEEVYEWLRQLFCLYLNCANKFLVKYRSLL